MKVEVTIIGKVELSRDELNELFLQDPREVMTVLAQRGEKIKVSIKKKEETNG